jgi:enoyl-CoA hydratase
MALTLEINGALGVILIDRPEKLNALDLVSFRELESLTARFEPERGLRGLIVASASPRAFCAGADISDLTDIDAVEATARAKYRREVLQKFSELPIPSIAVIDGLAMGGGVELALACSFRLATARASFSFPEIKLGLLPGAGGTQRVPRLIGQSRALDLMLTGRRIDASEALQMGLINRIVSDPMADAKVFAAQWLEYSAAAIQGVLAAVRSSALPIDAGLIAEGHQLETLNSGPDALEGVAAFLEKRTPNFNSVLKSSMTRKNDEN